jgi:hypothetical protein
MDILAYACMMLVAVINPGVVTLVFPFSIFGYAVFEEARPKKAYWHFIMFYT